MLKVPAPNKIRKAAKERAITFKLILINLIMASFVFILDRTIKKQISDGPIPQYVLAYLYAWLEAHSGFTNHAAEKTT